MTIFTVFFRCFGRKFWICRLCSKTKIHGLDRFHGSENPDWERTNQSTGICLRLALPYNKRFYHTWMAKRCAIYCPRDRFSLGEAKENMSRQCQKCAKKKTKCFFSKSWNVPRLRCKNANCVVWSFFTTLVGYKEKLKKSITCSEESNIIYNV